MNEKLSFDFPLLNREAWHKPLVSIVVTHHNYSPFLSDALLSVLDQTYENWECVVVDDCSSADHLERARWATERIGDPRIRFLPLDENVGQILAFFAGVDATNGEFVCLLDPDDRYAQSYLEEAVAIHLNTVIACPQFSAEQYTLTENGVTTAAQKWYKRDKLECIGGARKIEDVEDFVVWTPSDRQGWHWGTTSSIMFRRAALKYVRPHKVLDYQRCADSYIANGLHMLGGTLFYTKPLVYRSLHENNSFITSDIFSSRQDRKKPEVLARNEECRIDVFEALLHHKAPGITQDMLYKMHNPPLSRDIPKFKRFRMKLQNSIHKRQRERKVRRGEEVHPFLLN